MMDPIHPRTASPKPSNLNNQGVRPGTAVGILAANLFLLACTIALITALVRNRKPAREYFRTTHNPLVFLFTWPLHIKRLADWLRDRRKGQKYASAPAYDESQLYDLELGMRPVPLQGAFQPRDVGLLKTQSGMRKDSPYSSAGGGGGGGGGAVWDPLTADPWTPRVSLDAREWGRSSRGTIDDRRLGNANGLGLWRVE